MADTILTKRCSICKNTKPVTDFSKHKKHFRATCKSCVKSWRSKKISEGLCNRCFQRSSDGNRKDCIVCRSARLERIKNVIADRIRLNLCTICGDPVVPGRRKCQPCINYRDAFNKRYLERGNRLSSLSHRKKRLQVLAAYGGKCVCCGMDIPVFLDVDHIDGGGNAHYRKIHAPLTQWLYKNKFPPGFQILCKLCNFGKHVFGICPHQLMREGRWPPEDPFMAMLAIPVSPERLDLPLFRRE